MKNFKSNSDETIKQMLFEIGEKNIDNLFSYIKEEALIDKFNLSNPLNEMEVQKEIKSISKQNKTDYDYFIGAGAYKRFIPAAINEISSRFEFNTAYTPYQPEISQGTLQVIYEFQSIICNLTGMDVCNASVYDAANACAEAMLMAVRINGNKKILISSCLNPQYKDVIRTYAKAANIEIKEIKDLDFKTDIKSIKNDILSDEYAAIIVQNPNFYGTIEDIDILENIKKNSKTMLIVCVDIISCIALKKPSEYYADIVVGDVQSFGNTLSFGGPYAGFIASLDKYKRQIPGRIVGRTIDSEGNQAFTLTLQAREQHIRREKATSNICSNQGLAILNAVLYSVLMGQKGLKQAAFLSAKNANILSSELSKKGYNILNKNFFNEFIIEVENSDKFLNKMKQHNILAGLKLNNTQILVCTTEINSKDEIYNYIKNA